MTHATCKLPECNTEITGKSARGYCRPHYRLEMKYGVPEAPVLLVECVSCKAAFVAQNKRHFTCSVSCREAYAKVYAAAEREKNREKNIAYNRQWRLDNPSYHKDYNKQWRADNPESYKAYYTQYRIDNIDVIKERFAEWEAKNPNHTSEWAGRNRERARETVRRRRSRLRSVQTFTVTERDLIRMLARFRNCCAYCAAPLDASYHIDHVTPVSLGGANGIGNLVPACATCNVSKSNYFLSEWRYRDRLNKPLTKRKSTHVRLEDVVAA